MLSEKPRTIGMAEVIFKGVVIYAGIRARYSQEDRRELIESIGLNAKLFGLVPEVLIEVAKRMSTPDRWKAHQVFQNGLASYEAQGGR